MGGDAPRLGLRGESAGIPETGGSTYNWMVPSDSVYKPLLFALEEAN
jgi:hypothetical protein